MEKRNTARVSLSRFACFVCFFGLFCFVSLMRKLRDNLPLQINVQKSKFYWAGYLRGISFLPPKNIVMITVSNYIGKIIQTRRGQCTHCNISQNCVSKCTRLHFSAYSFHKNFLGEHASGPPLEARGLWLPGTSPPNYKS